MRALVGALGLCVTVAGCGGGGDVASAAMALSTSGLSPSEVAAVEVLVFDGSNAGCARVLTGATPLDDPGLALVAHTLFTIDGSGAPEHLAIPAGEPLDFYAEAFATAAPNRVRIGRGCVSQTLPRGGSATVSISISATD